MINNVGAPVVRHSLRGRLGRIALTAALVVAGVVVGVATAPMAAADGPDTFSNPAAIAIPGQNELEDFQPAAPYPSAITVSGMSGPVSKVTATLTGLSHGVLNDVDVLLVAPTGANLVLLGDLGDAQSQLTTANGINLTFDDDAAGPVPAVVNVPGGTYRPTNGAPGESFPAPAPAPSAQTTLAGAFSGIDPNGTWQLFIVDDTDGDTGSVSGGWSVTITTAEEAVPTTTVVTTSGSPSTTGTPVTFTATVTAGGTPVTAGSVSFTADGTSLGAPVAVNASGVATLATSALAEGTHLIQATYGGATGFLPSNDDVTQVVDNQTTVTGDTYCNTGPVTVGGQGPAQPYPSHITVSGRPSNTTKVTAELIGVSHTEPGDLDVLLAGPNPASNIVLLSDAGGSNDISGVDLGFDDAAAGPVPSPPVTGTYLPTDNDIEANDPFPGAPTPSGATELATFNGTSPNGTWSLYVFDDASADAGSIAGGWCLTITTVAATETVLSSSVNPSVFGQSVTFTASVSSGAVPVAEGVVDFLVDGVVVADDVPLDASGEAEFSTASLAAGSHLVVAQFVGTASYSASEGELTQVVGAAATTTSLTSSANPSVFGQSVTFTASVSSGAVPVAEGVVDFTVDGVVVADDVPLDASGEAEFSTASLAAGSHLVVAQFVGTASYSASEGELTQVVGAAATTTSLTSSANPSFYAQSVTFTATVTSGGAPVTEGSVDFLVDGVVVADDVALDAAGHAQFTTATLTYGSREVVAQYSGTATYQASSGGLTQVVRLPVPPSCGPKFDPYLVQWSILLGRPLPNPVCWFGVLPPQG